MSLSFNLHHHGSLHFPNRQAETLPHPSLFSTVGSLGSWSCSAGKKSSLSLTMRRLLTSSCSSFTWWHRSLITAHLLWSRKPPPAAQASGRGHRHSLQLQTCRAVSSFWSPSRLRLRMLQGQSVQHWGMCPVAHHHHCWRHGWYSEQSCGPLLHETQHKLLHPLATPVSCTHSCLYP